MTIVIFDYPKFHYIEVDDELLDGKYPNEWLEEQGYDTDHSEWFATNEPLSLHFKRIWKNRKGEIIQETAQERLRYGSVWERTKDLQEREKDECIAALKKYAEENNCKPERFFEDDTRPVVAGYWYDEPCDIVIQAVGWNETFKAIQLIGYDKNAPETEKSIPVSDLFPGQLYEITERI